jgi:hypothetical protein
MGDLAGCLIATVFWNNWRESDEGEQSGISSTEAIDANAGGDHPAVPAGVPRRLSLRDLLMLTAVFALLFGVLHWRQFPPLAFVLVAVFVAGVGVAQSLLFKARAPRRASIVAGGVLFFVVYYGMIVIEMGMPRSAHNVMKLLNLAMEIAFFSAIGGGILGYLAGCLIAAVFLSKRRETDSKQDT